MWVPDPSIEGVSHTPLPPSLPAQASSWVFKRCVSVEHIKSRIHSEDSVVMGDGCYPIQTGMCVCGLSWSMANLTVMCTFILRTCVGAISRVRYVATCKCRRELHWDPSSEYIHAISFDEGGTSLNHLEITLKSP